MSRDPYVGKLEHGLEAHFYTTPETFENESLLEAVSAFGQVGGVLSPAVVLPDVSHKADRISPTGMTLATSGAIVPAAVPAANGSGVRVACLDLGEEDCSGDLPLRFLQLLKARVPIYGEDSPALIRGRLREADLFEIYRGGARWLCDRLGVEESFDRIESKGCMAIDVDSAAEFRRWIPDYFLEQGLHDFGILESGNHFIEIQIVDEIMDRDLAAIAGLERGRAVVMIHDGSPASLVGQYFHPVHYGKTREAERFEADKLEYHARFAGSASDVDSRSFFAPASPFHAIDEGTETHRRFMGLMGMACNFGLANRAYLQHVIADTLRMLLGRPELRCTTVTDTLHDCVKRTTIDGQSFMIHRHGASEARAGDSYSREHPFHQTGQLLGIPGAPGRPSFLAAARNTARTWHTANHGAGRSVDRKIARERFREDASVAAVRASGATLLRAGLGSFSGEHPLAYKSGEEVMALAERAEILRGIARMRPVAIYKG